MTIKLALIGAGDHARKHHAPAMAKYAADHPGSLELVAVCDLDPQKAETVAETYGFRSTYTDYAEMIEREKPDGCICVVPTHAIAEVAIDLMQRGMPQVMEKPLGGSLEEAARVVAAAKETGTPHAVSVNRRFKPLLRKGITWAREQGPLRYVKGSLLRPNRRDKAFFTETGIHAIDMLREIGGEVREAQCRVLRGVPNWYHVDLAFESGAAGSLDVLPSDGSWEEHYELFGDGYRMDARIVPVFCTQLRCWKDDTIVIDEKSAQDEPVCVRVGAYAETEGFVTALAEGRPPWPSALEVFPSVELAHRLAAQV